MKYKNNRKRPKNAYSHLENAIFYTPAASANDCTGMSTSLSETDEKAENISSLLCVRTSPHLNKKEESTEGTETQKDKNKKTAK